MIWACASALSDGFALKTQQKAVRTLINQRQRLSNVKRTQMQTLEGSKGCRHQQAHPQQQWRQHSHERQEHLCFRRSPNAASDEVMRTRRVFLQLRHYRQYWRSCERFEVAFLRVLPSLRRKTRLNALEGVR